MYLNLDDERDRKSTFFDISKYILGSKAWGYSSLLSLKMISFVLFTQASQLSMNFDISELVY